MRWLLSVSVGPANASSFVALHGLSGHAWDSFASANNTYEGIKETCWLRDELPKFLEAQGKGIYPRVMTLGYTVDVWEGNAIDDIDTTVRHLIYLLEAERDADPHRPLLFIGHSLGGIVVKQVSLQYFNGE